MTTPENPGQTSEIIHTGDPIRVELQEDKTPDAGPVLQKGRTSPSKDWVRAALAVGLVLILGVLCLIGAIAWTIDPNRDMSEFAVLLAPITGIVGTAIVFYFQKDER